ncbi:MAG: Rab family GTPase [Candidatus Hodarchaeota archaeon]
MESRPKVLKTIITGEGGVGKTTLLHRYIEGKFLIDTRMTIGVEFFLKEFTFNTERILLQIWDFGGQERFRFLLKNYAKGAKGALLMFDLTRPITLETIDEWVDICRSEQPDLPILLVGSKADLTEMVNLEDNYISEFKEKYNLFDYLRVSSKTGENVNMAFELLAKQILDKVKKKGY